MPFLSSCVLVLLFTVTLSGDETSRLRPLDPLAAETIARAIERSTIVRALADRLESSNVIVHVEMSRALPLGIGGTMRFVASRGGHRFVRVSLSMTMPRDARTWILGHELQHACELADSTASDIAGVRKLYEAVGHRGHGLAEVYETRAAIDVERRVRAEVRTDLTRTHANGTR